MIRNEKGSVLFQILIVILFVGLLFTLLYPNKVWKEEAELANVCQTRMETIRQIEFFYLSDYQVFNDTINVVVENVLKNKAYETALDTLINWDNLVTKEELKNIVLSVDMPSELNTIIKDKIASGSALTQLSGWDSLKDDLLMLLQEKVKTDSVGLLDTCIDWSHLVGSNNLFAVVKDAKMSEYRKKTIRKSILNDQPLNKTRGWSDIRPHMIDTLSKMIVLSQTEGTWEASEKSKWGDQTLVKWSEKMDLLADSSKKALWQENINKFWDKERDIVWRKDRTRLWKAEGEAWTSDNEAVWKRILNQRWKLELRKNWLEETQASLPDSLKSSFKVQKDSLWKVFFNETEKQLVWEQEQKAGLSDSALVVFEAKKDSLWKPEMEALQNVKFDLWLEANNKDVKEVIQSLWESERMLSWKADAYANWLNDRESKMDKTWEDLKEELWKTEQIGLWQAEEKKLALKKGTYRKIDYAVHWEKLLTNEEINVLVDGLDLPDSNTLWNTISDSKNEGSPIMESGIAGLFKETLLNDLGICPVAKLPYLLEINNESRLKTIAVKCPIVDKEEEKYAISLTTVPVVDDSTNEVVSTRIDTTKHEVSLSSVKKMFGGAKIKSHGNIDSDGKNSWEKRGQ